MDLHKKKSSNFKTKIISIIVIKSSIRNVEDLNCSICLDYIIGCRIAICGHSFCDQCISEWLVRRKVCNTIK